MADNDFKEPTGMYNTPAAMAAIFKNTQEARKKNADQQVSDYRVEAGKSAEAKNADYLRKLSANGVNDVGLERQRNQMEIPDREVSDEACKKILKKRVDNMKQNWGETDEMKRQKKKKEGQGN